MIILLSFVPFASFGQEKSADSKSSEEAVTRSVDVPQLCKRLISAIKSSKLQADSDGAIVIKIKSGNHYDLTERQQYVFSKKAKVFFAQDKISKIIFEYYQYDMLSSVREVKTFTNYNPESDDLSTLEINYTTNTGQSENYKVTDLKTKQLQKDVILQYVSYMLALVHKAELYKNSVINDHSSKIERTIQLGN